MKNKFHIRIVASVMLTIFSIGITNAQFAGGTGSPFNPFKIATPAQLNEVRNDLGAHYVLIANLDMSSIANFVPIGSYTSATVNSPFTGSFDGAGFTISNLTMTSTVANSGLFGYFAPAIPGDAIKNVVIENSTFTLAGTSGSLVGRLHDGTVFNCQVDARIHGTAGTIGGIVGTATGNSVIARSWFGDTISSTGATIGGIVGSMNDRALLTDCYTTGHISSTGTAGTVGGISGSINNNAIIQNSYTTASVVGINTVGGIVGMINNANNAANNPTIRNTVAANRRIETTNAAASNPARRIVASSLNANNPQWNIIRNNYGLADMNLFHGGVLQTTFPADSLNGLNGLGKTLVELQTQATYVTDPMDWNFNNVWTIETNEFPIFSADVPQVDSVRFAEAEIGISKEITVALNWTVYPAAADQTVFFESSDEDVVTVTDAGVITSVEDGTAQVKIFAGSKTDIVTITVISTQIDVDSVRFDVAKLELEMIDLTDSLTLRRRDTLKWTVYPDSATVQTVTFESLDESIATVDARGLVTGISVGETKVVVHAAGEQTDTATIVVIPVVLRGIEFVMTGVRAAEMQKDSTVLLEWITTPKDAADQAVTFEMINESVATVNAGGTITGVEVGRTRVVIRAGAASRTDTIFTDTLPVFVFDKTVPFAGGTGTKTDPYKIATPEQFNVMRHHLDAHFVLVNDLNMSSIPYIRPMGSYANDLPFTGSFDGGGFTITNLSIDVAGHATRGGIFGYFYPATPGDAIENFTLANSTIELFASTGAIVGRLEYGTVQNIAVTADITGNNGIAGIVGDARGRSVVQRCWFGGTITATSNSVAGIVFQLGNSGTTNPPYGDTALVTDCFSTGRLETTGNFAGGIVGTVGGFTVLQNSYSTASLKANNNVGGIAFAINAGSLERGLTPGTPNYDNWMPHTPTIQNCVAANSRLETVATTTAVIGRVVSASQGTGAVRNIIRNNYAWETMPVYTGSTLRTVFPADSLNGFDGLSQILYDLELEETYTTAPFAWNFTNVWEMDEDGDFGYLPILRWLQQAPPTSILNPLPSPADNIEISVYPNPTRGDVKIEIEEDVVIRQILIYTMTGQLVFTTTKPEFNIEKLQPALYIVHIVTDKGNYMSRVMKW